MTTKIAVIDDDDGLRRAIAAVLSTDDREVVPFSSGNQFVEERGGQQFDAALLDLKMPGLSGLEVLEHLKPLSFPILMMSAHGDVRSAVQAIKLGAVDFIEKPFRPEDLEQSVDEMVRSGLPDADTDLSAPPAKKASLDHLTPREQEVALLLNEGMSNKEVARELDCSPRTVEVHRARIFSKLGVSNIAGLIRIVSGLS